MPLPLDDDAAGEYEVEDVLDSYLGHYRTEYLTKWQKKFNIFKEIVLYSFFLYKFYIKLIYTRQIMAIWSLRGFIMPWHNQYELWVLQEAAVGGCNGGSDDYNIGGWNGGGGYNFGNIQL